MYSVLFYLLTFTQKNKRMPKKTPLCIRQLANPAQIGRCREALEDKQSIFRQFSQIFALTGNEVRLKILFLLEQEGKLCPCDLSDILRMSIPAVSQHLRKLKDAQLIEGQREGQTIFYSIRKDALPILQVLLQQLTVESP